MVKILICLVLLIILGIISFSFKGKIMDKLKLLIGSIIIFIFILMALALISDRAALIISRIIAGILS